MNLQRYATLIFDCDGVILDSNRLKTQAFYDVAKDYGISAAESLVKYHTQHGGVSRYRKFDYFLRNIVSTNTKGPSCEELINRYALVVRQGLHDCIVADGLHELRERLPDVKWVVVSGGDQHELREIFDLRGLACLYDGGIYGSPATKEENLSRQLGRRNIAHPALFLGDSHYDYEAATRFGIDFVFVSAWTEFKKWQSFVKTYDIECVDRVSDLICMC